jgi:hypothetical protein
MVGSPIQVTQPLSLSPESADRGMVKRGTGVDEADPSVEEIKREARVVGLRGVSTP